MSANPSRKLKRHAMHECGWRTEAPRSGRGRGFTKKAAAQRVDLIVKVQESKRG